MYGWVASLEWGTLIHFLEKVAYVLGAPWTERN
jgi:hypothetical protein